MKAKADAEKLVAECCQAGSAIITKVEQKEKAEKPPTLFDLTSLQREANRQLGFTAQQTLDYTQALYRGFKMELSFDSFQKEYQVLLKGEMTHRVPIGTSAAGTAEKMESKLQKAVDAANTLPSAS